jgi:hypothetical protein
MQLQLYMASIMKPHLLERHDFYVAQTQKRVLDHFRDLEGEADRYCEAEYKRLLSGPGDEYTDVASLAETAHDNAIGFYGLLADLQQQVILGALAGLYHQWEKELRAFIERELMHDVQKAEVMKVAWHALITDLFDLLTHFGWAVRSESFFPLIDACRLIVNVYKHGKGRSLDELNRDYPHYLRDPFGPDAPTIIPDYLDHTLLTVTEEHFTEIAAALRAFWVAFPVRLYLSL